MTTVSVLPLRPKAIRIPSPPRLAARRRSIPAVGIVGSLHRRSWRNVPGGDLEPPLKSFQISTADLHIEFEPYAVVTVEITRLVIDEIRIGKLKIEEAHLVVFENAFEFERMQQLRIIDISRGIDLGRNPCRDFWWGDHSDW